ncbi:MAG: nicotinamide mononucleotide deamidase-related protein [archaeon]|nr:nicotinamide mononucleotide deamidase-related protein [archaeon]MCP8305554.1 nicotinamide mononucleotide deamidase-related protein [archaeon]
MDVFEIISVGNELLNGKTLNTNAHWLAKAITELGGFVRRCTVIRDDVEEISSAVRESMERGVDWLIVSGGLGPTYDDKTLQGLAKALHRELILDEDALKMVKKKYEEIVGHGLLKRVELTPARMKMATLPKGSKPLPNPLGTAPGVLLKEGRMNILCLPGVPAEMKSIFKESISPIIEERRKGFYHEKSVHITGIVESELAPLIEEVLKSHPSVYVKSHPKGRKEGVSKIEIQVTTTADDPSTALRRVEVALEQLTSIIIDQGGMVDEERMT